MEKAFWSRLDELVAASKIRIEPVSRGQHILVIHHSFTPLTMDIWRTPARPMGMVLTFGWAVCQTKK